MPIPNKLGERTLLEDVAVIRTLLALNEVPDGYTIGLGAAKGRLEFNDEATDVVAFEDCRVGIGTTAPGERLTVIGVLAVSASQASYDTGFKTKIETPWDSRSTILRSWGDRILLTAEDWGNELALYSNSETMRLKAGKVGIGTTAPGQIFDVNQGSGNMIADGYDSHSLAAYKENIQPIAGALDALTLAPPYQWQRAPHISAEELREFAIAAFGAERWIKVFGGSIDEKGQVVGDNHRGGKLCKCSDAEMLTAIDGEADRLRVERRSLPEWQRKHYGLVADSPETTMHLPNVVSKDDDDQVVGYSLGNYVGLLHAAIIEQQAQIDSLEARLAKLETLNQRS